MIAPWRDRRGKFLPLKAAVLAATFVPASYFAYAWIVGDTQPRPITEAIHGTGDWAIRFFLITLAVTPFARMYQWPGLLLTRRMLGLTGLAYLLAHFFFYVMDEKFAVGTVTHEILARFYLTIGFVALLGFLALGITSTDAALKQMGRWWKRLHYAAYPLTALGVFHYFIQVKANVSEPVFVAGLYTWLMLWRTLPAGWQRGWWAYPVLAPLAAVLTAGIEFAWYGLATRIDPWRVLAASETLRFGLRPAHYVLIVGLAAFVLLIVRRTSYRIPRILSHSFTNRVFVFRKSSQSSGTINLKSVIGTPPGGGATSARAE
jgi:methionine sulfoxide reductase heme-binding subunit